MRQLTRQDYITLELIIFAFIFSLAIRYSWIYYNQDNPGFYWDNKLMITTNDGYYWAEGTRDILQGGNQYGDLSPITSSTSVLTAFLAKVLPFSFESIILWMPAFLGSLLVIPIVLLGRSLGSIRMGFGAALIASIAHSYYNRTMLGYYDTDMLIIVFPVFLVWSVVLFFRSHNPIYILLTGIEIIAYRWWYPQSYSLEFAFMGIIGLYVIFRLFMLKNKKELSSDHPPLMTTLLLLSSFCFAMMMSDEILRFALVVVCYIFALNKQLYRFAPWLLLGSFIALFATGGINPIISQLKGYVFRTSVDKATSNVLDLHFFSVVQTIAEAGGISFETFANRISGNVFVFVISTLGYIVLLIKRPVMLFTLPLVALGFLSIGLGSFIPAAGLRFTIYAVVPFAFGFAFLFEFVEKYISSQILGNKEHFLHKQIIGLKNILIKVFFKTRYISAFFWIAFISVPLYSNIKHAFEYSQQISTVFDAREVYSINELGKIADREDYVLTWWDYGYPIRYYADVKTLVDGGKHEGYDNFYVAYALTQKQSKSAHMARLAVEQTEKVLQDAKKDSNEINKTMLSLPILTQAIMENNFSDANDFLDSIGTSLIKTSPKTRDIYYVLPYRMGRLLPVISQFSSVDLMSGKNLPLLNLQEVPLLGLDENFIQIPGAFIDRKSGIVKNNESAVGLKRIVYNIYDKNNQSTFFKEQVFGSNGNTLIVNVFSDTGFIWYMDEKTFQSTYVQLFIMENPHPDYFEIVSSTPCPWMKVYKLKI